MSKIYNVSIAKINPNPFRDLKKYPYDQAKLDALMHSMEGVGCWEGIIARWVKGSYQLAFGHHRLEAARRLKFKTVPVIVRQLDDEQMCQFMGRENLEDYRTSFLLLLESWEGGVKFYAAGRVKAPKSLDIATVLGWTRRQSKTRKSIQLNDTASACHAAYALINGGYLDKEDLAGLSVKSARLIVERAHARVKEIDKMEETSKLSKRDKETTKKQVGKGAKATAKQVREGTVAQRDIRGTVDQETYQYAVQAKKKSPLFEKFAQSLSNGLDKVLWSDANSKKLVALTENAAKMTSDREIYACRRVDVSLEALARRAETFRKNLQPGRKVVKLIPVPAPKKLEKIS